MVFSFVVAQVFISFLAMVTLGVAVGLVLLPVLLSIVGPVLTIRTAASPPVNDEAEDQSPAGATSTTGKKLGISNV